MKRGGLVLLLLLSLGINIGLVAGRWLWGDDSGNPDPASEISAAGATQEKDEPIEDTTIEEGSSPTLPPRLERGVERMADELGLAGEPRSAFIDLQQQFFRRTVEARRRGEHHQQALRRELIAVEPDARRADELLAEVIRAQGDLEQAFLDNFFATRALLGPDQRRPFLRLMGRLREIREEPKRRRDRFRGPALHRPSERPGAETPDVKRPDG